MAHFLLLLPNECHKAHGASIFQRARQAGCKFPFDEATRGVLFCPAATPIICEFMKPEN